jgi:hypothetical protein
MIPEYTLPTSSLPWNGESGWVMSSQTMSSVYVARVSSTLWAFSAAKWRSMMSMVDLLIRRSYRPGSFRDPTPIVRWWRHATALLRIGRGEMMVVRPYESVRRALASGGCG